jgi:PAS domain S-box-containing protein
VTIDSDSARFTRALKSAILLPVGAIFVAALVFLLLIVWLFQAVKSSEHSYQVLAQARTCERLVVEMQNNARGYLLTDDHAFSDSFDKGRGEVDESFGQLKQLVQDNPEQVIRAADIIQSKDTWVKHVLLSIGQQAQIASMQPDWTRMGKTLMDDMLSRFDVFTREEERLREARFGSLRRMKELLCYSGVALVLLISLTVAQVVRRQFTALATDYRMALGMIEQRHAALMRSEADLEEQKEWFRVTLASIGDAVMVTDREGRVVFMNGEAERLSGWTSVEALLKPLAAVFNIVNEATRAVVEDPVTKVFREKKVVGLANHTLLISRSGEEWPIEDSAAPIRDTKGKMLGVVLVFHNAVEMRRTQNELKAHSEDLEKKVVERTTALQQTVSELEAFSYTVSHDLRSPLRAMQGFAQAVLEDYGDKLGEQGKNYLDRIRNAAERLDRLIQDLLSYTRMARSDAPLAPLDLDRTIRELIEHYPNLNPPAAQVQVEGPFPKILGQETALTQVISNLLGNAVKFIPVGTVPKIRIWSENVESRVRLWIEDNGIGIVPQDQERIFQMFVQVNGSQLYGGTGIGLALVKKAVQTMRGAVGVVSEKGKGSKFWVELNKAPG